MGKGKANESTLILVDRIHHYFIGYVSKPIDSFDQVNDYVIDTLG